MSKPEDALKTVETQATIINLLSDTVDELFRLLMEHISAEEADRLPVLKKINAAATLKEEINKGGRFE